MKKINGQELIQLFEQFSPKKLALDGDKIGLQIGRLNKPVARVMVALDVLESVVDEAIAKDVDLIIAHHPLIFQPLQHVLTDTSQGRTIEKLLKNDIAVYTAHTNLDVTDGGVNDMLAAALQLTDLDLLVPTETEKLRKLVVFVPKAQAAEVREALGRSGAGAIGNYSHCSYASEGTGRFLPGEDTNPHTGRPGALQVVEEVKIETIYPESIEKKVLAAMLKAHPYEEVAYDLYPLANDGIVRGIGKIGYLKTDMTLADFAEHVKKVFQVDGVRVVGDLTKQVKKVAVLGGDGNKYFPQAKFAGADVYVTGDMYYHTAHDAQALGLSIVDPGHHIEQIMKQGVTTVLNEMCAGKNYEVEIFPSEINTDPFQFI